MWPILNMNKENYVKGAYNFFDIQVLLYKMVQNDAVIYSLDQKINSFFDNCYIQYNLWYKIISSTLHSLIQS